MFIDQVKIKVVAGKGGNGVIAWRREKYIPKGGPFGGNGGIGGSLILEADPAYFSLEGFRHRRILVAENGHDGGSNLKQGRAGRDLTLKVPYGTIVKDAHTGEILFDFVQTSTNWIACRGGKGGKGNAVFKSPTNQAPNICTPGTLGEELELELELKLIANVGLVGMPNAGKSTLMSKMTHARVKIAPYPFTTLSPNLSYVECEDYSRILVADIPGIIQNAHLNKGLGFEFLRHIERTELLVFVIDVSGQEGRDPLSDFEVLRSELGAYNADLLHKPFLVALNKIDAEGALENVDHFIKNTSLDLSILFKISALETSGLVPLIAAMQKYKRKSSLAFC